MTFAPRQRVPPPAGAAAPAAGAAAPVTGAAADEYNLTVTRLSYSSRHAGLSGFPVGKQKKLILFKVTEPSSIPFRTHSACAQRS